MKDIQKVVSNVFSLAAVRGLDYLVPLITLPYLVRVLGMENFGLINYALSFSLYFSAVIQYGFSVTAVRSIASNRDDLTVVSRIYSETITAILILIGCCGAIYLVLVFCISDFRVHSDLYLLSFCFVAMQALFPVWFYQGMENMRQGAIISIVAKLLFLIGIFIFVSHPEDFYRVPALNAIAFLGCSVFSFVWIKRRYGVIYKVPSMDQLRGAYWKGRDAFLSQLAPNLYNNSATFLLGYFGGGTIVGVYSSATKVVEVFNAAGMILSQAFFPYLVRNKQNLSKFHRLMVVTGIGLAIICWFTSDWIVIMLFSQDNIDVAHYIRWLSMGIAFYFTILAYHNNYLMLVGRDDVVRRISIYTSILFFMVGVFIVPVYMIFGSVFMLLGARFIMAGWGWMYCIHLRRHSMGGI